MSTFLGLVLVVGCLIGLIVILKNWPAKGSIAWPVSSRSLMNAIEWKVYDRLREALPDHVVFAQVALSQMIDVRAGKDHLWARNKIDKKVADFVVLSPDRKILAVIEVDGPTHQRASRKRTDADKDGALIACGYTLHRINAAALPTGSELRTLLLPPAVTPVVFAGTRIEPSLP